MEDNNIMENDYFTLTDEEGNELYYVSDLEKEITNDPSIVRSYLSENNVEPNDYLVIGEGKFDADAVDFLGCDIIVEKKSVWGKFTLYCHKRVQAKKRWQALQRQSRELSEKRKARKA